jgi:molecular chaperone GrpE
MASAKKQPTKGTETTADLADGNAANGDDRAAETADIASLIAERDSFLDELQRSRAEFVNYRRRIEQERAQLLKQANRNLLFQFLPILDDFQRALAAIPEDQRETPWVQGIGLIERKVWSLLERAGVTPLDALGQPFDPAVHEAVEQEPGTKGDTVVGVYQPGYRLGESLLRPAIVKVGDMTDENGKRQTANGSP